MNQMTQTPVVAAVTHALDFDRRNEAYEQGARCAELNRASLEILDAGARTLGTDIPIVSEADSRAMRPDYYLVLPWHFKEEFLQREADSLRQGIKFIFPLPNIEIA